MERVTVMAVGCVLMGDDGVGAHVLERLKAAYDFPPPVELIDVGTPGHDLPLYMEGRDLLVVVDAVRAAGALAGEVRVYDREALLRKAPARALSPHDPGLVDACLKLGFTGGAPRKLWLVGVVPMEIDARPDLSEPVRAAVPSAMEAVLAVLRDSGIEAVPKAEPRPPDFWWRPGE